MQACKIIDKEIENVISLKYCVSPIYLKDRKGEIFLEKVGI